MESLHVLKDYWPLIQGLGYILIAIVGLGWRQVGLKIETLSAGIKQLSEAVAAMTTQHAVTQTNLQAHTERDRESFHEVRNDLSQRILEVHRRLDELRSDLNARSMGGLRQ